MIPSPELGQALLAAAHTSAARPLMTSLAALLLLQEIHRLHHTHLEAKSSDTLSTLAEDAPWRRQPPAMTGALSQSSLGAALKRWVFGRRAKPAAEPPVPEPRLPNPDSLQAAARSALMRRMLSSRWPPRPKPPKDAAHPQPPDQARQERTS
jgi:hypothetical protein